LRIPLIRVVLLALAPARAAAVAPVCFPERTVLWAEDLKDAAGRRLGGVRAGQTVRVLDDRLGDAGKLAEVEVEAPLRIVGRVRRKALLVFAADDLEVVPRRVWWLRGRALTPERQEEKGVRVTWAEPHGEASPYPSVVVPCDRISGKPVGEVWRDQCHGATPDVYPEPEPEPPVVWWKKGLVVRAADVGGAGDTQHDVDQGRLLKERGDRALVEFVDTWEGVRIRAWVPSKRMRRGPPQLGGRGTLHLCCEGRLRHERGRPAGPLAANAPIHATPGEAAFATLPAGAFVRWQQIEGDFAKVLWRWPVAHSDDYTLLVEGWVARGALPDRLSADATPSVNGRVALPPGQPTSTFALVVVTFRSGGSRAVSRAVQPDGRFRIDVDHSMVLHLHARTTDGAFVSPFVEAESWSGGHEDVVLMLGNAWIVRGRVVDRRDRPKSAAEVLVRSSDSGALVNDARTDDEGRFEFHLPPGAYKIRRCTASNSSTSGSPRTLARAARSTSSYGCPDTRMRLEEAMADLDRAVAKGDVDTARDLLGQLLARHPTDVSVWEKASRVYLLWRHRTLAGAALFLTLREDDEAVALRAELVDHLNRPAARFLEQRPGWRARYFLDFFPRDEPIDLANVHPLVRARLDALFGVGWDTQLRDSRRRMRIGIGLGVVVVLTIFGLACFALVQEVLSLLR